MIEPTLYTSPRLEESYYDLRHPTGLRILVAPKALSTCYATLGIGYGSRDRLASPSVPMGTAHFLEHKMFEGEDGSSWEDVFSALGAEVNAYTSDDCTAYMFSATEHLSEALEALLRMVLRLSVTPASVRRERSIIAEEIRMNADDPWEVCYAEMLRGLYAPVKKGGNPVCEEICGTVSSIRRITPAVLQEAYDAHYRPENMVLAVSGPITLEAVTAAANRVLADYKPTAVTATASRRRHRDPREVYRPRRTTRMDTAKPLFSIGVKLPDVPSDPAELAYLERVMTVLSEMLFSRSGDFYSSLFENGTVSPGMAYGSSLGRPALYDSGEGYGYFYLSGECDDPEEVFTAFTAYVDLLRREGLDPAAFERARRTLYADYVYGFDSTESISSALLTSALDGVGLFDLPDMGDRLTMEDVTELFESAFQDTQYTLSSVLPRERNS